MEVITIESEAFKQIMQKLDAIAEYIHSIEHPIKNDEDTWVTGQDVCQFLKFSERTLQRLRTNGKITYSSVGGKYYYQISEINKLLQQGVIKSTNEHLRELMQHSRQYNKKK